MRPDNFSKNILRLFSRSKPANFSYKWDYLGRILKERKKVISRLFISGVRQIVKKTSLKMYTLFLTLCVISYITNQICSYIETNLSGESLINCGWNNSNNLTFGPEVLIKIRIEALACKCRHRPFDVSSSKWITSKLALFYSLYFNVKPSFFPEAKAFQVILPCLDENLWW